MSLWSTIILAALFSGSEARCDYASQTLDDFAQCIALDYARQDSKAAKLTRTLYAKAQWVADVEEAYTMNGGWRGKIRIVPQAPVGKHRHHLKWLLLVAHKHERLFDALQAKAKKPLRYRWRTIRYRFFRSVGRTTPSAYAGGWTIGYNVQGSLMYSASRVKDTIFHEIFHLNDQEHGDWSERSSPLAVIYATILKKCTKENGKPDNKCFSNYAPGTTKVYGKVYYAFHPDEGIQEYAAELGSRYMAENLRLADGQKLKGEPFKCKNDLNAAAWALLVDEFFGGADLVPACDGAKKPESP